LLIVDLDHFKRVNDAYGHRAGDQALQATAQALARSVRSDIDFVGRLGGEEFVVLLGAADEETARRAAESARAAIAAMRVATPNGEIAVTASIGYTPLVAGDSVSAALQRADEALYAAKRAGRNQIASRAPAPANSRRRRSTAGCAATPRSGCVDRREPRRQRAPAAAASARHHFAFAAQFQFAAGDGDGSSQTRVAPIVSAVRRNRRRGADSDGRRSGW
jgi:diguanylate cyclase (GGDEF)-like protein